MRLLLKDFDVPKMYPVQYIEVSIFAVVQSSCGWPPAISESGFAIKCNKEAFCEQKETAEQPAKDVLCG